MDPALLTALAASAFTVLQPHLSELAKSAAGALGKKVPDAIGALWAKLRARFADKPTADDALKDLLANPDDSDLQAVFRVYLRKLLQDDAAFADEIKELVESAGEQTSYTAETSLRAHTDPVCIVFSHHHPNLFTHIVSFSCNGSEYADYAAIRIRPLRTSTPDILQMASSFLVDP